MYRIGLVVDSIRDNSVGTGNYAKAIISQFKKYDKKNEYYYIDYERNEFNKSNLVLLDNPFKILKTYLWHLFLPPRLKKYKYDFIIDFVTSPFLFSANQKIILVVYDLTLHLFSKTHPFNRVLFDKLFFKNSLKRVYKIIVPSESTKRDLMKYYSVSEDRIMVIFIPIKYTPVNKSLISKKVNFNYPFILNINTIEPRKNISSLILAFNDLKKQKEITHKLVICGELGWKYKPVLNLVKEIELQKEVIFMGYVTEEEKKYLYSKADVFIYPSLYEGFGIPVLEAQVYGCPVVASNTSSLPEVVGKGGIMVNPYNVDEIREAIEKIIFNKDLRKKLINLGLRQSKKYTDSVIIEKKTLKLVNFISIN